MPAGQVTVAVVLSIVGTVIHNVAEFGWSTVTSPDTYISNGILAILLAAWLTFRRRWLLVVLCVLGAVVLVGMVLTVLPLPVLPFYPDQAAQHYLVHGVAALLQLSLPVISLLKLGSGKGA